jgi:hypothetical protein
MMILAMAIIGVIAGLLFLPGAAWGALGLVFGSGLGFLMARAGVRPTIGPAIAGGAVVGGWIGREIVRALCLPGSCTTVEVFGGIGTGIGSMFGIGLVTALVVRSFEEYRGQGGSR